MNASIYLRLSFMMFLQYAVWGFWLPVLGRYLQADLQEGGLGFSAAQVGWVIGLAGSAGALTAPFIAGQFADRKFRTERFLAVLILTGGIIKWITAYQTTFSMWLILSVIYGILYMPTLSLTNSLSFAHLNDPERQFPNIRVWGTIGWIVASVAFPMIWLQTNLEFQAMPPFLSGPDVPDSTARLVDALKFSGGVSVFYALFCLFLPATPPKPDAIEPLAFKQAFGLFRKRSFTVLVLTALPISIIHQIYFMQTGPFLATLGFRDSQIGPVMSIGQFAEIAVIAIMGVLLKRLGFRTVMFLGTLAFFARYTIFGTTALPQWVVVISFVLHGFCYAFFFAASFIYIERLASADYRHSAQTVFGMIILGLGPVLAAPVIQVLDGIFQVKVNGFSGFWYSLAGIGLVAALFFVTMFRDEALGFTVRKQEDRLAEQV